MSNQSCTMTIFTPHDVWKILRDCKGLHEFREQVPNEFKYDFDIIIFQLQDEFNLAIKVITSLYHAYKDKSDTEVGEDLARPFANIPPWAKKFVFLCRKNGFLENVHHPGKSRKRLFKEIEPKQKDWEQYPVSSKLKELWSIMY